MQSIELPIDICEERTLEIWQAVVLGIVEGITEFLPISSTGHLVVTADFIGLDPSDRAFIAFNALIQGAAILAILVYFFQDILRISVGWCKGVFQPQHRGMDYRFGWYVIVGTIPIVIAGLILSDYIDKVMNIWIVAVGMIGFSFVMWWGERVATHQRTESHVSMKDAVFVGLMQVLALFPGVSRSAATMTGGLLRDLDRVAATRLAFFLGIPALVGAGILEADEAFGASVPLVSLLVGALVSGVVAYASVAWLMKFVSKHTFMPFVYYRLGFGAFLLVIAATGAVSG
ncbi:undecaprenyl-diphosphate phosphatase [Haloglycomyces albus]|uniref:undecaprenyl-diphosphate phosphatase n=1 Tax=Haloglycomyces albus TaxID=526067 RepID=UPI0004AF524C|nr:undecaprenyl-diphosphate phosphatase [Haloglycomyces albus]